MHCSAVQLEGGPMSRYLMHGMVSEDGRVNNDGTELVPVADQLDFSMPHTPWSNVPPFESLMCCNAFISLEVNKSLILFFSATS